MEKIHYQRFLIVKDDFYQHPKKVRQFAQQSNYYEPENYTGRRSRQVYHEPGIKKKLERILGIKITRWDTDPEEENGVFYQGFAKGKWKEIPGVHADLPYHDITVLIYLTPDLPMDCGTSLWRHKQTGLINPPTYNDARKLGMPIRDLRSLLESDSQVRDKWIEIDRVGHLFNRMVAYPSGALHSATRHYGHNNANGRLYQTFRIGVDWTTFKM